MTNSPVIRKSACRICAGQCGLEVEVDASGHVQSIRGDRANPLSLGYACIKGLTLHEALASDKRILKPLRRMGSGGFEQVSWDDALSDIGQRLTAIASAHSGDAIGAYKGTLVYSNFLANAALPAFLQAINSTALYSTMTVDQSAKWVVSQRLGVWSAGRQAFDTAEVLLIVGSNPLVSLSTMNIPPHNPVKALRKARAQGLKLIVIDPRKTETAAHADLLLQPLPGEDVTVLAALLHVILKNDWHDAEFCRDHVDDLDALQIALAPFTPDYAARRAGVDAEDLIAVADLFARPVADGGRLRHKRGSACSGTGPDMGPRSNLAEHLVELLNVVCGRYARAGDRVPHPGVVGPRRQTYAQVVRMRAAPEERLAPSQYPRIYGERMAGALCDDVLTDDPARLRALIVAGGNPALALPDSRRTAQALTALDLLVVIDPFLSETARHADYVLPPLMMLERHEVSKRDWETTLAFAPYAQYTPPVAAPPAGADLLDDWEILWEIARHMGKPLDLGGVVKESEPRHDSEDLIRRLLDDSAVGFDAIRKAEGGKVFDVEPMFVQPARKQGVRFSIAPADVISELEDVVKDPAIESSLFRFACRRVREVQNTMYHDLPGIQARMRDNPACMNPDEMARLGLADDDEILISGPYGALRARARRDASVRPGVVSMTHGWGGAGSVGWNVNELTSSVADREPLNAMSVLTGFPVSISRWRSNAPFPL